MDNLNTEQKVKSQERSILRSISFKDFVAVCQEYNIVENAINKLLSISNDPMADDKYKIGIFKWFVEMNIGKPRQIDYSQAEEDKYPQKIIVEYVGSDENQVQQLREMLVEKGYSEEEITSRLLSNSRKNC
jgi:hypothetical protein